MGNLTLRSQRNTKFFSGCRFPCAPLWTLCEASPTFCLENALDSKALSVVQLGLSPDLCESHLDDPRPPLIFAGRLVAGMRRSAAAAHSLCPGQHCGRSLIRCN